MSIYYWYVTYAWAGIGEYGNGAAVVDGPKDWLPIKATLQKLRDLSGMENVVILDWKPITAEQADEWRTK